jgi:CDP-diacylglycerol--serine O-phosphatidyltransferase
LLGAAFRALLACRTLGASHVGDLDSLFGAQLDSLCDIINFGICPAMLVYLWGFAEIKLFGWATVMFYVACMTIRLARFNAASIRQHFSPVKKSPDLFFTGVPAPAGATLLLLPVILSLPVEESFDQRFSLVQAELYVMVISLLLVSPIATFSAKAVKINSKYIYLVMTCFVLFLMCCIVKPWVAIPIVCMAYLFSIPISAVMGVVLRR